MTLANRSPLKAVNLPEGNPPDERSMRALFSQSWLHAKRVLGRWRTHPTAVGQALLYPAIMLLMFRVVLGDSIDAKAAITGQRAIFGTVPMMAIVGAMSGASINAFTLLNDTKTGLVSRFATLPMHRGADLMGRLIAEAMRIAATVALMIFVGYFLGFQFEMGLAAALAWPLVPIGFGLSFALALTALTTATKTDNIIGLVMVLTTLLMFFNTGFVPLMAYPSWIQPVVENQPVSCAINAMRALSDARYVGGVEEPLIKTALWSVGLVLLSIRPAIRGYRNAAAS